MSWLTCVLTHPITLIGLGGAVGSNARYWIGLWFRAQPWAQEYTWGTFVINVSGSLLLGIVAALFRDRAGPGFLLLGTGFCGGYTTFSTFSLETLELVRDGKPWAAAGYVLGSVLAGLIGVWLAVRWAGR
jgi:fluoride exporter